MHALKKRVRSVQKEKLALRSEIMRIRAEREQVALKMDAVRIKHERENRESLVRKQTISTEPREFHFYFHPPPLTHGSSSFSNRSF